MDRNHVTAENALKKIPDEAIAPAASYARYPTPRFAKPVFIGSGLADVVAGYLTNHDLMYAGSTMKYIGVSDSQTSQAAQAALMNLF